MYLRVEVEVRPTESEEKVLKALRNIVDVENVRIIELRKGYKLIVGESNSISSLKKFHDLLRKQRILDTARNIMMRKAREGTIVLKINKQAAFQGILTFAEGDLESPLGSITLTIVCENLEDLIDWLAPRTSHGKPLWERVPPSA